MKKYTAVTRNKFGKGIGWHFGANAREPAFYDALMSMLLKDAGVSSVCRPPEGVDCWIREGAGRKLLFLVNFGESPKTVSVPAGRKELLTGATTGRELKLGRFGVAVIKLK